jgi:hypothetical protein
MSIQLKTTPPYAPGEKVAEMLRGAIRVARSETITPTASPATVTVCKVPANTLILGVLQEVISAFSSTGALTTTLGDSDVAAALVSSSAGDLTSSGFIATFNGKYYEAAQDLLAVITNASSFASGGAIRFWLLYQTEANK